ncbi:UNVERIFIED_ORG: hypothetical protein ABIB52_003247 [Arthrobacter sp. UYCu721]
MTADGSSVHAAAGIFTPKIQLCHVAGRESRRID